MRFRAVVFTLLVLGCSATVARVIAFSSNVPATVPIIYASTPHYEPMAWMRGRDRFPEGAALVIRTGEKVRKLAPDFAASADPNISFDGKSVLFAGKEKSGDPWQIWEVTLDDGVVRRILTTEQDAVRPMYLPESRFVFAEKVDDHFVIETASLASGKPVPLFFAPGSALPTDVLRDGRILFEAGYPLGDGTTPEIYTVYSDGSGVESYRCDHGKPRYAARETVSGDIVFTRGKGLGRFTSPLAHDVDVEAPRGEYSGDVAELPDGEWLVSTRSIAAKQFEVKRWKPGTAAMVTVDSESGRDLVQAVPIMERRIPNRHPSGLHNWNYANLLALNAYTSKLKIAAGEVAQVRLYTLEAGAVKSLGEAPVEKDGSFFIQVPGDHPLRIELLDAAGRTLAKENGWWYARRGEQRICVGCHAGPERAPDNAVPEVLLRTQTPVDLTGTAPIKKTSDKGGN